MKQHQYTLNVKWTGNLGQGTQNYTSYKRTHVISAKGKESLLCSADPVFLGDEKLYNPEEMLLASVASCHMLWYLHLCADAGISVLEYSDNPMGIMDEIAGKFTSISLFPSVRIQEGNEKSIAEKLHTLAHQKCFIANSLNFEVLVQCKIK